MTISQELLAVMEKYHPLASKKKLRLSDCAAYPVALPDRSIGGRQLLEEVSARSGIVFNVAAESNSFEMLRGLVLQAGLISFQIAIGMVTAGNKLGIVARRIDGSDVPRSNLVFGHLRGRNLPIVTTVFVETLRRELDAIRAEQASPAREAR
jgi:hypothetical protein